MAFQDFRLGFGQLVWHVRAIDSLLRWRPPNLIPYKLQHPAHVPQIQANGHTIRIVCDKLFKTLHSLVELFKHFCRRAKNPLESLLIKSLVMQVFQKTFLAL